jgi:uncharacterized protein
MSKSTITIGGLIVLAVLAAIGLILKSKPNLLADSQKSPIPTQTLEQNPLAIEYMRSQNYPGSNFTTEQTLKSGTNYKQSIVSYSSDGLKIYGLLTIPNGTPPDGGWPVIVFNHGYIQPDLYTTTGRYVAYVDVLAKNGYIVFKPDYRGNGKSEGNPTGAYYSPDYTIDVLNAIASVKKLPEANPNKIGLWGHSMGGNITLRVLTIDPEIKAAVIWGGVVGTYNDLMNNWARKVPFQPPPRDLALRNNNRQNLIQQYGTPQENPTYWNAMDPRFHLDVITAPIQLDAGGADEEVPVQFSADLNGALQELGKTSEFYTYPGADHNISGASFNLAMKRTVDFYNQYLK